MTTSDPSSIAGTGPAKPSARRYYVWQFAMWISILHTALIVTVTVVRQGTLASRRNTFFPWYLLSSYRSAAYPIHVRVADFMTSPPFPPILASFLLVPIVVIACHRSSMGKRAWRWWLGYWLLAATTCAVLLGSMAIDGCNSGLIYVPCCFSEYSSGIYCEYDSVQSWLLALRQCLIFFLPLPLTLLAALLTLERKKGALALEAAA